MKTQTLLLLAFLTVFARAAERPEVVAKLRALLAKYPEAKAPVN